MSHFRTGHSIPILLIFALLLQLCPVFTPTSAEAAVPSYSLTISDGTNSKVYQDIRKYDEELYFPAAMFGQVTGYTFTALQGQYVYVRGSKYIYIDSLSGNMDIPVLNYSGSIGAIYSENGQDYLPASTLLPWMNVTCSLLDDGVLEIIPDCISFWDVIDTIDITEHMFNLYEEYGDSGKSVVGLGFTKAFDYLLNLRIDRLVPADGSIFGLAKGESVYDMECFADLLFEMAVDDTLLSDRAQEMFQSVVNSNRKLDTLEEDLGIDLERLQYKVDCFLLDYDPHDEIRTNVNDLFEFWQDLRLGISVMSDISEYFNLFSAFQAYETILKTSAEYHSFLNWLSEQDTGNSAFNLGADKAALLLDENDGYIYSSLLHLGETLMKKIPKTVLDIIISNASPFGTLYEVYDTLDTFFNEGFFGSLDSYLTLSKLFFSQLGITEAFEGMAKIDNYEKIQDYCLFSAIALRKEVMTGENLALLRQCMLVALRSARQSFLTLQELVSAELIEVISGSDNDDLMDYRLEPVEERIIRLTASADSRMNDSIDGKDVYQAELLELFSRVLLTPYFSASGSFELLEVTRDSLAIADHVIYLGDDTQVVGYYGLFENGDYDHVLCVICVTWYDTLYLPELTVQNFGSQLVLSCWEYVSSYAVCYDPAAGTIQTLPDGFHWTAAGNYLIGVSLRGDPGPVTIKIFDQSGALVFDQEQLEFGELDHDGYYFGDASAFWNTWYETWDPSFDFDYIVRRFDLHTGEIRDVCAIPLSGQVMVSSYVDLELYELVICPDYDWERAEHYPFSPVS